MRLNILSCLFALGILVQPHGMASTATGTIPYGVPCDTNTVIAPGTEEEEIENDDYLSSALLPTRTDTLPAYTLGGQRMDLKKRNANARTLYIYNIVIKNGRKIVKRDR